MPGSDHDDHGHGHALGHHHAHGGSDVSMRALTVALVANGGLAVAQVAGGLAFHSLALVADAVHQVVDVFGLVIAVVAARVARRAPTSQHTYGWPRAEALGALVSALLLVGSTAWLGIEAIRRLTDAPDVNGAGVILLAVVGVVVNGASAVGLIRSGDRSLNVRAAVGHLLADAAGSGAVLAAGVAVVVADARWVDPAVTLALVAVVLVAGVQLLQGSGRILLEAAPVGLDAADVVSALLDFEGVVAVHHLHLWSLSSAEPALSAHVVLEGTQSLHDAQERGEELKSLLVSRFGVGHATLELECHPCSTPEH